MENNRLSQQFIEHGKVPPQAVDLEEAVLGAAMLERDACHIALNILKPESFYKEPQQKIFAAIGNLFNRSEPVDIMTVSNELKTLGELEMVGGPYYITMLTSRIGSGANIETHSRIILQKAIQRKIINVTSELAKMAFEDTTDVFEVLNRALFSLNEINSTLSKNQASKAVDILDERLDEIKLIKEGKIQEIGIPSHIPTLNDITHGFRPGHLIILAARPSMGKTAFMLCLAKFVASSKYNVAIFSLEMTKSELIDRLLSMETAINHNQLKQEKRITDDEFAMFRLARDNMASYSLYIDDTPALNITELRSKAVRLKTLHDIDIIFIDYLQLMRGLGKKGENREREISTISASLKQTAKELDVPVFALSQLSRAVENRPDKRPMLSDLRESGCLTGDTKIQCPSMKKTVRIRDLVGRKDFNIFAFDINKVKYMIADKCFKSGEKEVFEIELLNGQTIQATNNHKFLTEDGWVKLSELEGKRIAIPFDYGNVKDRISSSEVELVGHFLSNGCMLIGRGITYTCNVLDDDLSDRVMLSAKKACKGQVAPKYKDSNIDGRSWRTIFFKPTFHLTHGVTSPMADIFRKYNIWDLRSKQKFIPDQFFYLSHEKTFILLKALFTGDGTVYYYKNKNRRKLSISYSSSSSELILGIQQLLSKVGIISFITKVSNMRGQKWQNLYIPGKANIMLFAEKIGFYSERKNKILSYGISQIKDKLAGWNKYSFNKERTLCYMPIKNISTKGIKPVYDIEVNGPHNFVANNMIVHNSIEQDADMVMFLFRPWYYKILQNDDGFDEAQMKVLGELDIAKHRGGECKVVYLKWVGHLMSYYDFYRGGETVVIENELEF